MRLINSFLLVNMALTRKTHKEKKAWWAKITTKKSLEEDEK
jgi:hypothetical protein